jgi:hypothetical protein
MSRPFIQLLPILLALAHCASPPPAAPAAAAGGGQTRADAATLAACRTHADEVYDRQRRDTIYTIGTRDSPFSANDSTTGVTDRGLAQRYGRENMIRDCVRNTGLETDRSSPETPKTRQP